MKRRKVSVLPIVRTTLVIVMLAVIVVTAVFSCTYLYEKNDLLTQMYNEGIIIEIPGYKASFNQRFTSTDMGSLYVLHNEYIFTSEERFMRNQREWFREDYLNLIDEKIAAATTDAEKKEWETNRKWAEFDASSMYYLYMTGYFKPEVQQYCYISIIPAVIDTGAETIAEGEAMAAMLEANSVSYNAVIENVWNANTLSSDPMYKKFRVYLTEEQYQPLLDKLNSAEYSDYVGAIDAYDEPFADNIRIADQSYVRCLLIMMAEYLVLLCCFAFIREKGRANCFLPKGEMSSIGLPAYVCNILSFLTLGLFGVVLFVIEKKSRYTKQMAAQAMLVTILTAIFGVATWAMFIIFSFMFDPVKNIAQVVKHTTWILTGECFLFGLLMSIFNRSFILPVVGKLAVNSSYVD